MSSDSTASNTLLGAYIGTPGDPGSPWQSDLSGFESAMGQAPAVIDTYVAYTLGWGAPIQQHAQWGASVWQQSGVSVIPDVGIPMATQQDSSADQAFRDIAAGVHDADFKAMFQAYSAVSKTFYIRPGWEMDGNWYPWSVNQSNLADYIAAFQHIAALAHSFSGADIKVVWCPAANDGYGAKSVDAYPGDQAVDMVGIDSYGVGASQVGDSQVFSTSTYSITTAAQLAVAHNKPLSIDETGDSPSDTPAFTANLVQAIQAVPGVVVDHINIWNDPSGGAAPSIQWSGDANAAAAWKQAFAQISAYSASNQASVVPPVGGPASANDTVVLAGSGKIITDAAGNAWTITSGGQIAVNGVVDAPTNNVSELAYVNGSVWQYAQAWNSWYEATALNGDTPTWSSGTAASPLPANSPPTPSPNGTKITAASAPAIIDQNSNSWTLVQSADPTKGLQIAINGIVDAATQNVLLLEYLNGAMVQQSIYGWYSETQPNDSWVPIANPNPPAAPAPVTVGTGSDSLVLSISEDAYANGDNRSDAAGDARFTVSVDGKQLAGSFTAQASHAAAVDQTFTFKGNWAPGSHTVAVNFLNDAWAGTASTDRNLYVDKVTYDGTNLNKSAALMALGAKSFAVADNTALPPPVTGSGSDMLVVKVSEDYYLGNAQFTVSVDGKQLGGTFTTTILHSSGGSQAFAFAGDFGAGQHSVSVKFLNDAWGGTASTDRNLYVNDIVYNGTDTKATATLLGNGLHGFTVSGGTTPLVRESSDHGSLQKTLSQTGTYTVGGDSVVLSSGNAAAVTLGTGASQLVFVGPSSLRLTGGAGSATVAADAGTNTFTAGSGSLDVTGGGGKDAYVFHANSGLLTIEDFSAAKGDKLVIDSTMKGSMVQAPDYQGGTLITFGSGASHAIDVHGLVAVPANSISWA